MTRYISATILAAAICLTAVQVNFAEEKSIKQFPADVSWGRIVSQRSAIELHVRKVPENGTISFPRLNNRMKSLHFKGETPEASKLKFKPQITTWEVTLPKELPSPSPVVFFETVEPIELATKPHVVKQSKDGSVVLPAHHVVTHGKLLRYEPQPHKNTMGYWANADDWAEWHVAIHKPLEFNVEVLQGCGKGQGGSNVEIELADSKVQFTIEDTGHFQNFKPRVIGKVRVAKPGDFSLKIRAVRKAKNAVCDIRQIRLLPVSK